MINLSRKILWAVIMLFTALSYGAHKGSLPNPRGSITSDTTGLSSDEEEVDPLETMDDVRAKLKVFLPNVPSSAEEFVDKFLQPMSAEQNKFEDIKRAIVQEIENLPGFQQEENKKRFLKTLMYFALRANLASNEEGEKGQMAWDALGSLVEYFKEFPWFMSSRHFHLEVAKPATNAQTEERAYNIFYTLQGIPDKQARFLARFEALKERLKRSI